MQQDEPDVLDGALAGRGAEGRRAAAAAARAARSDARGGGRRARRAGPRAARRKASARWSGGSVAPALQLVDGHHGTPWDR